MPVTSKRFSEICLNARKMISKYFKNNPPKNGFDLVDKRLKTLQDAHKIAISSIGISPILFDEFKIPDQRFGSWLIKYYPNSLGIAVNHKIILD
jgi:hypothetical protein